MTHNSNLKRRVRARAAKTGESYTTALSHLLPAQSEQVDTRSRPRLLTIAMHSWLKNDVHITDERGELLYTASWRARFPTAVWTLKHEGQDVATLRRKALAPLRTSVVKLGGHEFTLRKKFALSRITQIHGGPFDGAILSGSLADRNFRLEHRGSLIAEGKAELLSMKGRHTVRLAAADDPMAEIVMALMMVDLLIQKYEAF